MSDLFGNHIVGFPTRRLISKVLKFPNLKLGEKISFYRGLCCGGADEHVTVQIITKEQEKACYQNHYFLS